MQTNNFEKFWEKLPNDRKSYISKTIAERCYLYDTNHRRTKKYLMQIKQTDNMFENYKEYIKYVNNYSPTTTDYLYNIELNSLKYNVSVIEATAIVQQLKSNKATSKEKFIKRFGEVEGLKKFIKFQETSKRSSLKIKSLGEDKAKQKYREGSRRCYEFYLTRGLADTVEQAKILASNYQKNTAGVNKQIWIKKGFSPSEIESIISEINSKKANGYKQYQEKYPDNWQEVIEKRWEKLRKTTGAISKCNDVENYYREVEKYTILSLKLHSSKIDQITLRSRDYHLDHIFSKKQGYIHRVDPEIIGHWSNLRIISATDNCKKQDRCDITLTELFENYYKGIQNEN